ncbi:MAG: HepT-like ribonuclease domain-containing protein [Cyclobacteriaceae bacterium]
MKKQLTDQVRISHVLDAIGEVEKYLDAVSYDDFFANSEKRFATIKQVEIIGEACNRISKGFTDRHPEIKWKENQRF